MKWENIKYKERNNWKKDMYWLLIWLLWNVSLNEDNLWDMSVITKRDHKRGAIAIAGEHE